MSCYMSIFVRNEKKNSYTEILTYSRSTSFYDVMNRANSIPYEKATILTLEMIDYAKETIRDMEVENEKSIERLKEKVKAMASWNNSVGEKYGILCDFEEAINDYREENDCLKETWDICEFLQSILLTRKFGCGTNKDLYIGIEVDEEWFEEAQNESEN